MLHSIFTDIEAKSLKDLCALIVNCDFFFGNEGGPRHISQALGVPSYAIFPPNISKKVWLPNEGERYAGISPDDYLTLDQQRNMTYAERFKEITVERVWEGLSDMCERYFCK